jgi:hypothetical protein
MTALDAACEYRRRGWQVVPIPHGMKRPIIDGSPEFVVPAAELSRHFSGNANIGVRLGLTSGDLVDIDLDCPEALALQDIYLPGTNAIFGRPSKPRSHRLYIARGGFKQTFADPRDGKMLVELRADGRESRAHQTILPPSVVDGERREWCGDTINPAVIDAAILRRRVAWLATGCLVMRHLSEYAARRPGPDFIELLQEADQRLGDAARLWLHESTQREANPKPHRLMTNDELRLEELVAAISNDGRSWDDWNRIGLAIYAASGGSVEGYIAFDAFSARCVKYDPHETKARWRHYYRSPPTRIGLGTLVHLARENGWTRRATV